MADANPAAGDSTAAAQGLAFGLAFPDLYERDGLLRVDAAWRTFLDEADTALAARYEAARAAPDALDAKAEAALLIEAGPAVDAFVAYVRVEAGLSPTRTTARQGARLPVAVRCSMRRLMVESSCSAIALPLIS